METAAKYTNELINETSPYLLQHAHNPVNWHGWNDAAWAKAKAENKLVLVSIGYSSCHWCHVMEHETFEDTAAALLMNDHFVCIKVDREERPDVDQVYMTAVQLMTGGGGWPLNCFCLPDGRPLYGGTYFQNAQWKELLLKLHQFYASNKVQAEQYAEELTHGIRQSEIVAKNTEDANFEKALLDKMVENWQPHFDMIEGGPNRAPKFPTPNNYEFLLSFSAGETENTRIGETGRKASTPVLPFSQSPLLSYTLHTLDKMAFGGIYDQLGGGFARYSTDSMWKVPHFEKMLYDNAQLVSLYSHAYQLTGKQLYKDIVYETLDFISREMTSDEGGFYSALDADSEGKEGKYYVWKKDEVERITGADFNIVADYYNVNKYGLWEDGDYILLRRKSDDEIAREFSLSIEQLLTKISDAKQKLMTARSKRIRPGLDTKQLTSWNMLMTKGYCDAYEAFGDNKFLDAAIRNANHILSKLKRSDGGLNHSYKEVSSGQLAIGREEKKVGSGQWAVGSEERNSLVTPNTKHQTLNPELQTPNTKLAPINGYLEDYSFTIEALIKLYEVTFDEKWLNEANALATYAIKHFYDEQTGMFWFTSDLDPPLITRRKEINDNVIPASNSSLAKDLFLLGKYYDDKQYASISATMLNNVKNDLPRYPSGYSNWAMLMLWHTQPFYEVAIAGSKAETARMELAAHYLPNKILAGTSDGQSKLPLLQNKFNKDETVIYVCRNNTCKLPVRSAEEAIHQMNEGN